MKLTLPTKQLLIVFFLLISFFAFSQENKAIKKMEKSETSENKSKSFLNQGVRGSFGGKYQFIDSSGDKYVGLAYEGNGGFGIALKLFVYDGFFIGGTFGSSYFKNINKSISGNYDKTRVNYTYLFLGYEYKIIELVI